MIINRRREIRLIFMLVAIWSLQSIAKVDSTDILASKARCQYEEVKMNLPEIDTEFRSTFRSPY